MKRFSSNTLFTLAIAALVFQGCGGSEESPLGVSINVVTPDSSAFPSLNPFEQCDYVKVCFETKDKVQCNTVKENETDGASLLKSMPYGMDTSITMECIPEVLDENQLSVPADQPRAKGTTCPFVHKDGDLKQDVNLFLLPVSAMGPTMDANGIQTVPEQARWGAAVITLYDDRILMVGGAQFKEGCEDWESTSCIDSVDKTAEIFDPRDGSFTTLGSGSSQVLKEGRAFATPILLPSGDVALFGGVDANGNILKSVEIFDHVSETFIQGSPMKFPRVWHTATLIHKKNDGYILLVGGKGEGPDSWEIWNKGAGVITSGSLQEERWNHTAVDIQDLKADGTRNKVVIAGGENATKVLTTYEIFDLSLTSPTFDGTSYDLCLTEDDKTKGKPAKAKTMLAAAYVPEQGLVYFAGGFDNITHTNPTSDICVWNAKNEKFVSAASNFKLSTPRGGLTATTMADKVVLLAGGLTKVNGVLSTSSTFETIFEYVNEDNNKIIDVGSPMMMLEGRFWHQAMSTCDGRVLLVGGLQGDSPGYQPVEVTEVFNAQ